MRYLWLVLLAACGSRPDHGRELAACELISKSGDELASCLIFKYSWGADSAGPAKTRFQWTLDSLRAEHDAQAAAILAQQQARNQAEEKVRQDSLATEERHRRAAWIKRQAKLDSIGAVFQRCDSISIAAFVANPRSYEPRAWGRALCLENRRDALRQAGLPANALPDPEQ